MSYQRADDSGVITFHITLLIVSQAEMQVPCWCSCLLEASRRRFQDKWLCVAG